MTNSNLSLSLSPSSLKEGWQVVKFGEIAREAKWSTKTAIEDGLEFYVGLEHLDPQSLRIQSKGVIAEDILSKVIICDFGIGCSTVNACEANFKNRKLCPS